MLTKVSTSVLEKEKILLHLVLSVWAVAKKKKKKKKNKKKKNKKKKKKKKKWNKPYPLQPYTCWVSPYPFKFFKGCLP